MGCTTSSVAKVHSPISSPEVDQSPTSEKHTGEIEEAPAEPPSKPRTRAMSETPMTYFKQHPDWPVPCPPATSKEDVLKPVQLDEWEQRAITVKNYGIPNDFDTLAHFLCEGSQSELQRIRAIYIWVTTQDCSSVDESVESDLSYPLGYLAALKHDFGSYADLFFKICAAAEVPCITIKGYAKGVGYQPGQQMSGELFGASWNAVLIDKYWRLVDVHWGARFITGDDKKDHWKLIDTDTAATVQKKQILTYDSDDFYFLADPDKLIFSHFPVKPEWQLLDSPVDQKTFESQAFIKRHFFKLGLSIKSHPKAVIECPEGESDIQFALPMNTFVTFAYKLFAVKETKIDDSVTSNANKLSQFVVQQTMNKIISFNLSFPVTGQFLVELYAAPETLNKGSDETGTPGFMNHVCSYIINCTKAKPNCRALPHTVSIKGFGPGVDAIRKHLTPLSHQSGVILTQTGQVEVRFKMDQGLVDFAHFLHNNDYPDNQLSNYCVHRIVGDEVIFSVNLPSSGEYSLDIFGEMQANEESDKLPHLCSYLIRCTKPGVSNPPFAITSDRMFGPCVDKLFLSKYGIKFNPEDAFIITDTGEVTIEIESDPKFSFQGVLEHQTLENQKESMNKHVFFERSNDCAKLLLNLPKKGNYRLGVFMREKETKNGQNNPIDVFNYMINCTGTHPDLIQFPVPSSNWNDDCVLFEPKQGLLPYDEEVNFSVVIPGAESVIVVRPGAEGEEHESVCPLSRSLDDDDTWNGSVPTGVIAGDLRLAVVYKNQKKSFELLKFEVLSKEETVQLLVSPNAAAAEVESKETEDEADRLKKKEKELARKREEEQEKMLQELEALELDKQRAAEAEAKAEAELLEMQALNARMKDDEEKKLKAEQDLRLAREQAEEKKRNRIRKQLKAAIKQRDKFELVKALRLFEENEIPDIDGDYLEGQELLQYFHLRSDLLKAISSREVAKLQQSLDAVRKSSRDSQSKLQLETAKAERILESLRHIEKLRHAIMKLDQKTIAEIKNYSNPPVEVHQIFRACFLLLGTPLKSTEKWGDCLVHIGKMGRKSLKRRINTFNITSVSISTAQKAQKILEPYTTDQIRNVSSGAAAFYVWSIGVIKEIYSKEEDDDNLDRDAPDSD